MSEHDEARAWIAEAASSKARKRLAGTIDQLGPPAKSAIVAAARKAGVALPDDAASWPAKKLLRRAQGRMEASQVRKNPIHRDESFSCVRCAKAVPPHGRSARDHCPFCLFGLHVDGEVPGDRASPCGGVLEPRGVLHEQGRWILLYTCASCGEERRNQVLMDGEPPDDWKTVVALGSP